MGVLIFCQSLAALAQAGGPAAVAAQAQSQSSTVPTTSFKAAANLVLIDVVVDEQGNAIHGLARQQFHIFENGKEQSITVFEEHKPADKLEVAKPPQLPPNIYSNFPEFVVPSAANVLLLDALNTPISDQIRLRQQMIDYLRNIPPGTRIAVFTLASRLRLVQGFTTDPDILQKAIRGGKGIAQQSVLLETESDQQTQLSTVNGMENTGASQQAISSLQQFQADVAAFQTDLRVRMTLDAMGELGRYLSVVPGRKNLIWFSGSFPLLLDPDSTLSSPFEAMRNYSDELRQTSDLLEAARVAVYPVDARGLMTLPSSSASYSPSSSSPNPAGGSAGRAGAGSGGNGGRRGGGARMRSMNMNTNPGASSQPGPAKDDQKFLAQTIAEHDSMRQLAEETGGQAFMDTNGLKDAVAHAIAIGSNYYTIGYVPDVRQFDGSFRKLQVKVDGGPYQLAYRRGYYADDPVKPSSRSSGQVNNITVAMQRGAPPMAEILFKVHVMPADDPSVTGFKPSPEPAGLMAKGLKGPVKRYLADFAVNAPQLNLTATPDGAHHGQVEFALVAYDTDGKQLNAQDHGYSFTFNTAQYQQIMRSGLPAHLELDLPAGAVFLRVGVHDITNDHVGSVEIPLKVTAK